MAGPCQGVAGLQEVPRTPQEAPGGAQRLIHMSKRFRRYLELWQWLAAPHLHCVALGRDNGDNIIVGAKVGAAIRHCPVPLTLLPNLCPAVLAY